jgi:hypothetical protein
LTKEEATLRLQQYSFNEIVESILQLGFKVVGLFPDYNCLWNKESIDFWKKSIAETFEKNQNHVSTIIKKTTKKKNKDIFLLWCWKNLWALGMNGDLFSAVEINNDIRNLLERKYLSCKWFENYPSGSLGVSPHSMALIKG